MKTHVKVAVIGGGVVGCSVLYHLTRGGWTDVALFERSELTSGSTWHAAGGMHTINGDPNVARLQAYTINLYREIEELSGQSCGVHITAGLMLAGTPERLDFLKLMRARGRYLGFDMELLSPAEARRRFPLLEPQYFVGALYNTLEGHVDPSGVTHAYAKAARLQGAEVHRFTPVVDLAPRPAGGWDVVTEKGTVHAEHVVNAGGLWAREVGRMVGLELPVLAMEHQYIISGDIPEVMASPTEMLHIVDFEGEIYMRQEGNGMLMGTYEKHGVPWSEKSTPWDFGHELLPDDLERIAPSLEVGFRHYPAIERAGIKRVVNGPFTFAPDGNPLVGPIRGLPNYWVACGVMAGFSQGGGVGLALSNWMIDGDPGFDIWGMDVSRFGSWSTMGYTNAKVRENYGRRFRIRFPNEELAAARPLRTTPVYDRLASQNAVFGASYGLEYPLWYAPAGSVAQETVTFRRSNAHEPVGAECRAVREAVGIMEISTYSKFDLVGPDAESCVARLFANRVPDNGRLVLSPMLNEAGRLIGDFTVTRLGTQHFRAFGSGVAEDYHLRWFEQRCAQRRVSIRALGTELVGFALAGPGARELLAAVAAADVDNSAFPFLAHRRIDIGMVPAWVGRVSFTGELGYEVWVTPDWQRRLHETLLDAGAAHGLRPFGQRALNSLRLEKSFGNWAREFRPIYGPEAAGLGRFLAVDRPEGFIGREGALVERAQGPVRRLVALAVDAADADAIGDEPIFHRGAVVGWVTSGAWGHTVGASLALGYVESAHAGAIDGFEVEILGERRPARRLPRALHDPDGGRMRA